MCPWVPDLIGLWKCWFLRRGDNRSTRRKTSRSKGENQQQTQPTYGVDAGIRTRATLVGGEHSHHCSIPCSPQTVRLLKVMQHTSIAPVVALFLATFENNWGYCIVFWRLALFVLLDFTTARLTITVNVITPLMSWQTGWTQLFSWRRRTDIFQAALTIWIRGQWTMFQVWRKEKLYTTQHNQLSPVTSSGITLFCIHKRVKSEL